MKKILLILLPVILVIISIITSLIAFDYTQQLEEGYLYVENKDVSPTYTGEYKAILGNLTEEAVTVSSIKNVDGLTISIFNEDATLIQQYLFTVKQDNIVNVDLIIANIPDGTIGELPDYLLTIDLEKDEQYELILTELVNNTTNDEIDLAFFHFDTELYNTQSLYEGISFTTFVFALLAGLTILGAKFVKKRD